MRRLRIWTSLGLCTVVGAGTGASLADNRDDPTTPTGSVANIYGGGGTARWWSRSDHTGGHPGECVGHDSMSANVSPLPSGEWCENLTGTVGPVKKKTTVYMTTPFVGLIKGVSAKMHCTSWGDTPSQPSTWSGYDRWAEARRGWKETNINGARALIAGYYGTSPFVLQETISAHTKVNKMPTPTPESPPVLLSLVYDGGVPSRDAVGEVALDSQGQIVWAVPPAVALEIRSTVSSSGSTRTYTYTIDNLSNEPRTFSLPQVTAPGWSSGWQDTVASDDTETLSLQVAGEQGYVQTCQVSLSEAIAGGTCELPIQVYVPVSRLAYSGTVQISSITSSAGGNLITFSVAGQMATSAALVRLDDGVLIYVAQAQQSYAPGNSYVLVDPDPRAGSSTYAVVAGVEPNGLFSEWVSFQN